MEQFEASVKLCKSNNDFDLIVDLGPKIVILKRSNPNFAKCYNMLNSGEDFTFTCKGDEVIDIDHFLPFVATVKDLLNIALEEIHVGHQEILFLEPIVKKKNGIEIDLRKYRYLIHKQHEIFEGKTYSFLNFRYEGPFCLLKMI